MTDAVRRLGYGGSAEVDGVQVFITSGSFAVAKTISYLEAIDVSPPPATGGPSRSRMKHADGIEGYTGDVALDVTANFMALLTTAKLLNRGYRFTLGIHDGESGQAMANCLLTSLSVTGSAGGLLSCSISVVSASEPAPSVTVANAFIRDQTPYAYWYSGNTDVRDWTLTMSQAVTPVYANRDVTTPQYMKVGLVDYTLEVTTYDQLYAYDTINIATATFQLRGNTASEGFSFAGVTDLGNYTHTFESAARASQGSGDTIIF